MHSRIFYLTRNKERVLEGDNLTEEMFFESDSYGYFVGSVADYVQEVETDNIEDNITWLLNSLKNSSNKLVSDHDEDGLRYIEFKDGFKEEYMIPVLAHIKDLASRLELKDLTSMYTLDLYALQKAIEDKFGFYILSEEYGLCNMCDFIRYMEPNTRYYIGKEIIDYHY